MSETTTDLTLFEQLGGEGPHKHPPTMRSQDREQ